MNFWNFLGILTSAKNKILKIIMQDFYLRKLIFHLGCVCLAEDLFTLYTFMLDPETQMHV